MNGLNPDKHLSKDEVSEDKERNTEVNSNDFNLNPETVSDKEDQIEFDDFIEDDTENITNSEKENNVNSQDVNEIHNAVQNKIDGCRRENEVHDELKEKYPEDEGYKILSERELCDRDGNPVRDEKTGEKRRIDFVVVKDGKVVDMVEVTSKTAPKRDQLAKEYRIRDNGGNYIKDADGNVIRIPNNVETRVERRN